MGFYTVNPAWADGNDHGRNIIDMILAVPDGTPLAPNTIEFVPLTGPYRSEMKILLTQRQNLLIDLKGVTVENTIRAPYTADGSGFYPNTRADLVKGLNFGRSVFEFNKCTNIRITSSIKGAVLRGAGPNAVALDDTVAAQNGINITGGTGYEIDHLNILNVYGVFIETNYSYTTDPGGVRLPAQINVHNCYMRNSCRQGVTCAGGTDYTVENCDIGNSGRHLIDLESDDPNGTIPIQRFTFRANKVGKAK